MEAKRGPLMGGPRGVESDSTTFDEHAHTHEQEDEDEDGGQ